MRGYGKEGVTQAIRAAGGEIYAITSEPQSLARSAHDAWETGFEHIGDPHQEIRGECIDRGWLSLFVADWGETTPGGTPTWVSHPKGYFQPGVLALSRAARVLYRWRSRPNRKNIGGAIMRPTASHVWSNIQAALAEPADAADAAHDDTPTLDSPAVPWPFFVLLLLANGWFLKPRYFDQSDSGPSAEQRQKRALRRIPFFFAAWIAAFALLPLWLAALGFAAWVAKVTPDIRRVNQRFQNVAPDEEPG